MSNVRVTDDAQSSEDLSGFADFDTPDNRELVIQWDMSETGIDPIDIRRYHIYLITPESENDDETYFADTRIGDITSIQWHPGNPLIAPRFSNGPQFNTSYKFAIYALTHSGSPYAHGPFENSAFVEYYRIREPEEALNRSYQLKGTDQ